MNHETHTSLSHADCHVMCRSFHLEVEATLSSHRNCSRSPPRRPMEVSTRRTMSIQMNRTRSRLAVWVDFVLEWRRCEAALAVRLPPLRSHRTLPKCSTRRRSSE